MIDDGDFVSVATAAARLGVAERQARRWAGQLPDNDRTPAGQMPLRVRFSALREKVTGRTAPDSMTGQMPDNDRTMTGHSPDALERLIAEKDARIDQLSAALDHERDAHKRAEVLHLNTQGELSELRRKAAQLEAANSHLIALLPAKVNETDAGDESANSAAPVSVPDTTQKAGDAEAGKSAEGAPEVNSDTHERSQNHNTHERGGNGTKVTNIGHQKSGGLWARVMGWLREH